MMERGEPSDRLARAGGWGKIAMAADEPKESLLDVTRSHVLDGRQIVANQRLRIERLRAEGRDTESAERILGAFERSQEIFEKHLHDLEAES
jgi:hypothetical protein